MPLYIPSWLSLPCTGHALSSVGVATCYVEDCTTACDLKQTVEKMKSDASGILARASFGDPAAERNIKLDPEYVSCRGRWSCAFCHVGYWLIFHLSIV